VQNEIALPEKGVEEKLLNWNKIGGVRPAQWHKIANIPRNQEQGK
jgi:hypothetical protein